MNIIKKLLNKSSDIIFVLLFLLTLISSIISLVNKDYRNSIIAIITIIIISIPYLLERKRKLKFSHIFKILIYFFIFSNSILGEVYHFYIDYKYGDFILHMAGGFIFTSIGLSLICKYKINFLIVLILTLSFSMTVSLTWEFVEYTSDKIFYTDTQKDTLIKDIASVSIDNVKNYKEEKVLEIEETILYGKNKEVLKVINGGYLDIGLSDTMSDLFANFLGVFIFWVINYLSIYGKKRIVNLFLIKKEMS